MPIICIDVDGCTASYNHHVCALGMLIKSMDVDEEPTTCSVDLSGTCDHQAAAAAY